MPLRKRRDIIKQQKKKNRGAETAFYLLSIAETVDKMNKMWYNIYMLLFV